MPPFFAQVKLVHWRAAALTVGLSLCLWVVLLGVYSIQAADPTDLPDAPGSISGIVTDERGVPLPGIEVNLYQGNSPYSVRSMTTDATGAYKAAVLRTEIYRIGFRDPQQRYATTYYTNAVTIQSATEIPVGGNNITGINAQLTPGGTISGTVSFTGTFSADNCPSCAVRVVRKINDEWQKVAAAAIRLPSGVYSVTALPAGLYRACISSFYDNDLLNARNECYDNIASGVDNAQDITVTAGQMTSNINFVLGDGADLATIGGQVWGRNGTPLARISVNVQPRLPLDLPAYSGKTDGSGFYRVAGLPVGEYRIWFIDEHGYYFTQYYNNTESYDFADSVALGPRQQRLDINAYLRPGAQITGTVRLLNQAPASDATVEILSDTDPLARFVATLDPKTGVYNSRALPPGIYRVFASSQFDAVHYLSGYYGGLHADQALTITVGIGETKSNMDVSMGEEGMWGGRISGQVTAQGLPQAGIKVSLILYIEDVFYTYTDATGHYLIDGLTDGGYLVGFSDPNGRYATIYYQDQRTFSHAQPLVIAGGQPISNVNAALQLGGVLSGHVRLRNGKPATQTVVAVYRKALLSQGEQPVQTQITDANGNYKMQGLWPDIYRVCFVYSPPGFAFDMTCYGSFGPTPSLEAAADIAISAGLETKGIDMVIGSAGPGRLYFPQIVR